MSVELDKPARLNARLYWTFLRRYLQPQAGRVAAMALMILASIGLALVNPQVIRYFLDTAQANGPRVLLLGAAGLFLAFAILELSGRLEKVAMPASLMPLGGAISGFFGGLSGIQGELRSAFLIKAGLDKHAFVATGVVAAVMVDTVRITIYGATFLSAGPETLGRDSVGLVAVACLAAFTGAFAGSRLLGKATLKGLHRVVAVTMIAIGLALAAGIV